MSAVESAVAAVGAQAVAGLSDAHVQATMEAMIEHARKVATEAAQQAAEEAAREVALKTAHAQQELMALFTAQHRESTHLASRDRTSPLDVVPARP